MNMETMILKFTNITWNAPAETQKTLPKEIILRFDVNTLFDMLTKTGVTCAMLKYETNNKYEAENYEVELYEEAITNDW